MSKIKCELCGELFNLNDAIDEFDEEYDAGSYAYLYDGRKFCLDCAIELYEEKYGDDGPPPGCRECGGDWPNCQDSCSMYDD